MRDIIYTSAETSTEFVAQNITWQLSLTHAANRFEIMQGNGDYYQDQGTGSSAGSLYFIFTPETEEEFSFFNAIRERGVGTLTQPDSATVLTIQPLSITKSIDMVNDVTRVRYTVTFATSRVPGEIESTQALFTTLEQQNTDAVQSAGEVLEASQDVSNAVDANRQVTNFSDSLNSATRWLNVNAANLEAGIDDIVNEPVRALIAFNQLIEQPGIIFNRLENKIKGYQDLITDLLDINPFPGESSTQKSNDLLFAEAIVAAVIAAKVSAVIEAGYDTKQQVLDTAGQLVTDYAYSRDTLDTYQADGFFTQSGATQESTSKLTNSTAAFLFSISFNLKTELVFTVDAPITLYDILADYYTDKLADEGEVATLDYIINTNGFTFDEIIEIPHGREVLVYV